MLYSQLAMPNVGWARRKKMEWMRNNGAFRRKRSGGAGNQLQKTPKKSILWYLLSPRQTGSLVTAEWVKLKVHSLISLLNLRKSNRLTGLNGDAALAF